MRVMSLALSAFCITSSLFKAQATPEQIFSIHNVITMKGGVLFITEEEKKVKVKVKPPTVNVKKLTTKEEKRLLDKCYNVVPASGHTYPHMLAASMLQCLEQKRPYFIPGGLAHLEWILALTMRAVDKLNVLNNLINRNANNELAEVIEAINDYIKNPTDNLTDHERNLSAQTLRIHLWHNLIVLESYKNHYLELKKAIFLQTSRQVYWRESLIEIFKSHSTVVCNPDFPTMIDIFVTSAADHLVKAHEKEFKDDSHINNALIRLTSIYASTAKAKNKNVYFNKKKELVFTAINSTISAIFLRYKGNVREETQTLVTKYLSIIDANKM